MEEKVVLEVDLVGLVVLIVETLSVVVVGVIVEVDEEVVVDLDVVTTVVVDIEAVVVVGVIVEVDEEAFVDLVWYGGSV